MFGYTIYITLLINFINKVIITKQNHINATPMSCVRRAPQLFCILFSFGDLSLKLNFRQVLQKIYLFNILKTD